MILHKSEFPITIQAFDITDNKEFFIAEQVVNSQQEADVFSSRYAGKVIKAKALSNTNTSTTTSTTTTGGTRRKSSAATAVVVILLILIILIAIGFYTGWIQKNTGITL